MKDDLYLRRAGLLLEGQDRVMDLSNMHFVFKTSQQDEESPGTVAVRVFNLSEDTVRAIRGEYSRVVVQAGYQEAAYGVIFDGTIKQYREGREPNGLTSYLDILAADGDVAYNFAVVSKSMAAGSSSSERIAASVQVMNQHGVSMGKLLIPGTGGVLPRGKVLFGLARGIIRAEAQTNGATWTIQQGKVNVVPLTGYLPGEAVVLTADTGLIGRVEMTEDGMQARCLMNPKLIVGGLVRIDNKSINRTVAAKGQDVPGAQLAYNRYAGIQQFAQVASDGLYRIYVAEHTGDTRGPEWYVDITALAVDPVTDRVKAYG